MKCISYSNLCLKKRITNVCLCHMPRKKALKMVTNLLVVIYYKEQLIMNSRVWRKGEYVLGYIAWIVIIYMYYFKHTHTYLSEIKIFYSLCLLMISIQRK